MRFYAVLLVFFLSSFWIAYIRCENGVMQVNYIQRNEEKNRINFIRIGKEKC